MKRLLKRIAKVLVKLLLKGLATLLPLALTFAVLWWLGSTAEATLAPPLKRWLPGGTYVPGMGVLAGLCVALLAGILTRTFMARWLIARGERVVRQIPLVKTVYGAFKDVLQLIAADEPRNQLSQVVLFSIGSSDAKLLGFLTRDGVAELGDSGKDVVAVYVPMSYMLGGVTMLVPRTSVQRIRMSVEDALRFAVTAGLSGRPEVDAT